MKIKYLIFGLVLATGVGFGLLKRCTTSDALPQAVVKQEEQGIQGALEYLNKRRMNPQAGFVAVADVVKARKKPIK